MPQNAKIPFLALKTRFCAQNHFFTNKCENERKCAKRVKMGFRIPKKALSTEGLAPWAPNERLRGQKTPIFAKFRTFAPKTRFGRFLPFWAPKERKIDLGRFLAPKTCPDAYVFHCLALGVKKMLFC